MVRKQTYLGLFMIALATLMYEILLTRIFSVTMWYHFAFVAISVTMFGMTVGAIIVYLCPSYFTPERAKYHLALYALFFALAIVFSFLTHLCIPFNSDLTDLSLIRMYSIVLTYVVIAVPFVFSGLCVCLVLTKFPRFVSKLYAADLAGAALGCILLIYTLKATDGPTAVIIVALLASIGAIFFAGDGGSKKLMGVVLLSSLLLASFAAVNLVRVKRQAPLLQLTWVKGHLEPPPLYEKWNSFSRVAVWGDPNSPPGDPFGWGFSSAVTINRKVRQLILNIDATAGTILTSLDGDWNKLDYLKYDVTNLAHYIRPHAKVLVVGTGGGRDILSALAFDQASVVGVEINENIIRTVNRRFGDFTGHLDRNPRVTFVNDEARSYIARLKEPVDIIQISLIDTWAATAAGAFVLTENSLYTVEAWKIFLERLRPNGVLTVSRWYFRDRPGEVYRLTSLASAALTKLGVKNPREHMIIVKRMEPADKGVEGPGGVGTILVSKEPFSVTDLDTIAQVTSQLKFEPVLNPRFASDATFATLASGKDREPFLAAFPINIAAPTDDSPFFFHMLRLRDLFKEGLWDQGPNSFNMKAVYILGALLSTVVGLTLLCIIVPLILTTKKAMLKGTMPLFIFFAGIGFGFMLIEISQMQRLIVFLGHPTYGLSVVLFALLLSSSLGSYWTQKINKPGLMGSSTARLFLLLCVLIVFGALTPVATGALQAATTATRIAVATVILFPLGIFMGMAFPLGMNLASAKQAYLTPWLWGINGATSVCASVVAVVIALSSSISASFWTGFACYAIAYLAFVWASRRKGYSSPDV